MWTISVLASLLLGVSATAKAPATKIDADSLRHDERRGITIFEGNVSLSRDGLLMKGGRLELRQLPNGTSKGLLWGSPATIRQQRLGGQEWVIGEANRIEYDSGSQVSILDGAASLRRMQGEILKERLSGDRLRYNHVKEEYIVDSSEAEGRARLILLPQGKEPR